MSKPNNRFYLTAKKIWGNVVTNYTANPVLPRHTAFVNNRLDEEPSYYNIKHTVVLTKSYDIFARREREILNFIVEGKSSKQIADALFISLNTVSTHRKNILGKASVKTPLDLVSKAIKEGWV